MKTSEIPAVKEASRIASIELEYYNKMMNASTIPDSIGKPKLIKHKGSTYYTCISIEPSMYTGWGKDPKAAYNSWKEKILYNKRLATYDHAGRAYLTVECPRPASCELNPCSGACKVRSPEFDKV